MGRGAHLSKRGSESSISESRTPSKMPDGILEISGGEVPASCDLEFVPVLFGHRPGRTTNEKEPNVQRHRHILFFGERRSCFVRCFCLVSVIQSWECRWCAPSAFAEAICLSRECDRIPISPSATTACERQSERVACLLES